MSTPSNTPDFTLQSRQSDFKMFCDRFPDNYAWADRTERPWNTWQTRYAAAVDAATTLDAYAAVFESALDELRDFHAEVRSHRATSTPKYALTARIAGCPCRHSPTYGLLFTATML
jgi:hypothetical protein